MARINFVVSNLLKDLYSGGIWCIFEYANGLVNRGHDVSIVPTLPTDYPRWFPRSVEKGSHFHTRRKASKCLCEPAPGGVGGSSQPKAICGPSHAIREGMPRYTSLNCFPILCSVGLQKHT